MRFSALFLLTILTGLFLVIAPSGVFAATAESSAAIDWDTLDFSFTGTGEIEFDYFQADAEAMGALCQSTAETNIREKGVPYQDLYAGALAGQHGAGYAHATAGYFGEFRALTPGTLTISMDYFLYINAQSDALGHSAFTRSSALVGINGMAERDELIFDAYDFLSYEEETPWLTLSLSHDLNAGDLIGFEAFVVTDAEANTVPIPNSALIFASGLAGFILIRRRH